MRVGGEWARGSGGVPGVGGGERLGPRNECNDPPYISHRHRDIGNRSVTCTVSRPAKSSRLHDDSS